jgi:putative oxidoreductase
MNARAGSEPKLLFPGLAGFYASVSDLWYPLIRVTAGAILFVHGWIKLGVGVAGITAFMAKSGYQPAAVIAYLVMFLETVGAICIVLGLFTRVFAAAIAIELAVIAFVHSLGNGFLFTRPGGGYEYPLLWGVVMLAIALRGGGPYSLDRAIGKEV